MPDGVYKTTVALVVCPVCKGRGEVERFITQRKPCPICKGDRMLEEVVILRRANVKKEGV